MTVHTFQKIICDWIGYIYDCYFLYAKYFKNQFRSFYKNISLQPLYESNEDVEDQLWNEVSQNEHSLNRVSEF